MAARIFTCHHMVPERAFRPNRLFSMLVSGALPDEQAGYLGDLDGENIAGQNSLSEIRHQYYVWRNLLGRYDYVGFEHYRRVFFIDPARGPAARVADEHRWWWRCYFQSNQNIAYSDTSWEAIEAYLDYRAGFNTEACAAVEAWMTGYDIIVQRPLEHTGLERQWKSCLPPELWDAIVAAVREGLAEIGSGCSIEFGVQSGFFNNLYIMRADIFDEYMTFLMRCLDRLGAAAAPYPRMLGHCAERIFSLWLFQRCLEDPFLRVLHHPFLHTSARVAREPESGVAGTA